VIEQHGEVSSKNSIILKKIKRVNLSATQRCEKNPKDTKSLKV
jgi:hypothetical protein